MSEERLVSKGIKSGVIEVGKKTIMKTYSWKPRLIVLNKGLIAVYSVNLKEKFHKGFINLKQCKVQALPNKSHCFVLIVKDRKVILKCHSQEDRDDWVKKIRIESSNQKTFRQTQYQSFKVSSDGSELESSSPELEGDIISGSGTWQYIDPLLLDDYLGEDTPEYMKALKSSYKVYGHSNDVKEDEVKGFVEPSHDEPIEVYAPNSDLNYYEESIKAIVIKTDISPIVEELKSNLNDVQYCGQITKEELSQFDGKTSETPIYISIKGKVYDVSASRQFYSPGSSYHAFAGREASRALAKMSTKEEDVSNTNIDDLSDSEISTLQSWIDKFESKYPHVGNLQGY